MTPKSIGFLCYQGWMCEPSLRKVGKGVLKLLIGNGLVHLTRVTLTFDPQINRIHLLPRMDGPSLKKVGQGVLELLIGTDLQTDRPQSNMPSLLLLHFKGMWICEAVCIL